MWQPHVHTKTKLANGMKNPSFGVRLIKVRNLRTKKDLVFATNLPSKLFTDAEISTLYQRRWQIETSFRDLTHTLKTPAAS
jgi:IS4 transposase